LGPQEREKESIKCFVKKVTKAKQLRGNDTNLSIHGRTGRRGKIYSKFHHKKKIRTKNTSTKQIERKYEPRWGGGQRWAAKRGREATEKRAVGGKIWNLVKCGGAARTHKPKRQGGPEGREMIYKDGRQNGKV